MNCTNCGAAMALVASRRYFHCPHCGTYHFPEAIDFGEIRQIVDAPGRDRGSRDMERDPLRLLADVLFG